MAGNQSLAEQRRRSLKRIDDATVNVRTTSGRVLIPGSGEATVDVNFPITFIEKPNFSYGSEMDEDFVPVAGQFPRVHPTIVSWIRDRVTPGFEGYFAGCKIAVSVEGRADHAIWLHWTMSGKALSGPSLDAYAVGAKNDLIAGI